MKSNSVIFVLSVLLSIEVAVSQSAITPPYSFGFEKSETAEAANWTLQNTDAAGVSCADKWYIGAADAHTDTNSLYISSDGGQTVSYAPAENIVVAYRKMQLPAGAYNITFDWKNLAYGSKGNLTSGLYVCILPVGNPMFAPSSVASSPTMPMWLVYKQPIILADGTKVDCLKNSRTWSNAQIQYTSTDKEVYLTFVWINVDKKGRQWAIGAAVDNLCITSATCPMPTALKGEGDCSKFKVSWTGMAGNYELDYRPYGTGAAWRTIPVNGTEEYTFQDLNEGYYDFRVRGVCGNGGYSNYQTLNGTLVFCPGNHCINYVDLQNTAKCYWLNLNEYVPGAQNQSYHQETLDFGPDDIRSRHTVHSTIEEYDPRTNYGLRTIPEGEYGSVRLGTWKNFHINRIEYDYPVDTLQAAVLLLKYAIVFQAPNHEREGQPYFKIAILDRSGENELNPTCGKAEFYVGEETAGWNTIPASEVDMSHQGNQYKEYIVWHDWTTLGLDLRPYHGQNIKIRIDSRDCTADGGGHYGYGYFTLGCAKGTIEGLSCGATEYMELKAPEGFNYEWTASDDQSQTVLSDSMVYRAAASDTREYIVKCSFKGDGSDRDFSSCDFTLKTKVSPRTAKADYTYEHIPSGCENVVLIRNNSHVVSKDAQGNTIDKLDERISDVVWDFGDGPQYTTSHRITVPDEGGTVSFSLAAALAGSARGCVDDTAAVIHVPSILSEPVITDSVACFGYSVQWGDRSYGKSGTYYDTVPNWAGCDSVNVLRLVVRDSIPVEHRFDTICYGDVYDSIPGYKFYDTGVHRAELYTADGCDSTIVVHLEVMPEIFFTASHTDEEGAAGSASITIESAPEGYTYALDGVKDAPLTGLVGGEYLLTVFDRGGCGKDTVIVIDSDCLVVDVELPDPFSACSSDSVLPISTTHIAGVASTYSITYGDKAKAAGFADMEKAVFDGSRVVIAMPVPCRPDRYDATLTIHDVICRDTIIPLVFEVHYDSAIIAQKWNDVLAIYNQEYNGGYIFSDYMWYKDGQLLPDRTPYCYIEGGALDTGAEYYAVLTRAGDGVQMPTCTVVPQNRAAEQSVYPTLASNNVMAAAAVEVGNLQDRALVEIFDIAGALCSSSAIAPADAVRMPGTPGIYVVVITTATVRSVERVVVR